MPHPNVFEINTEIQHKEKYSDCLLETSELSWSTFGCDQVLYDMKIFVHLHLRIFFSADPLQLCQVGWVPSVDRHLQVSPESFYVWLGSSQGSVWATQGHPQSCSDASPALSWLWAVGHGLVGRWNLSDGPEPLDQLFIKDVFVLSSIQLSLNPHQYCAVIPVPDAEKHPHTAWKKWGGLSHFMHTVQTWYSKI